MRVRVRRRARRRALLLLARGRRGSANEGAAAAEDPGRCLGSVGETEVEGPRRRRRARRRRTTKFAGGVAEAGRPPGVLARVPAAPSTRARRWPEGRPRRWRRRSRRRRPRPGARPGVLSRGGELGGEVAAPPVSARTGTRGRGGRGGGEGGVSGSARARGEGGGGRGAQGAATATDLCPASRRYRGFRARRDPWRPRCDGQGAVCRGRLGPIPERTPARPRRRRARGTNARDDARARRGRVRDDERRAVSGPRSPRPAGAARCAADAPAPILSLLGTAER